MATSTAEGPARRSIAAVVLAAGGGRRFGAQGEKLVAPFRGRPLVLHAVEAAVEAARRSGFAEVIVVSGAVDLRELLPPGVRVVENQRWAEGQATSLQVALGAAEAAGHDAVVVGLADQPLIGAAPWQRVAEAPGPIAVATYGGWRRNPVMLERRVWPLLPREGDEGARAVMRLRPELVTEVPCEGEPADIDTEEDLARWS